MISAAARNVFAVSDLHVRYAENREVVDRIRPEDPSDWLIVAGDVAEDVQDIEWALGLLRGRFAAVIWTPGNHELWSAGDAVLRGEDRYRHLVERCRSLGVLTPEDPYARWSGPDGDVTIAPLFLLYDYTFRPDGTTTKQEALERAYRAGVICSDEVLLDPAPYRSREDWCDARITYTLSRLELLPPGGRTVLVNHYPLVREPTRILRHPEFAQWCGTVRTADWHRRYHAVAVVYGHLHIPRTTHYDGVRFEEVSLGYPREWQRRGPTPAPVRRILSLNGPAEPGPT